MAIYAEISHKSISASATHRKLDLSASLVPALGNQISFSKLVGAANWRNLYLFDVHVNAERTVFPFFDLFDIQDSTAIDFGKVDTDQFGFESSTVFSTTKTASDSTSMLDDLVIGLSKSSLDLFSLSEQQEISTGKNLSESIGLSESIETLLTYRRSFSENTSLLESASVHLTRPESDSFGFSDSHAAYSLKVIAESLSVTDVPVFNVSTFADSVTSLTDNSIISRDPYNFIFSESDGVRSVTGSPTDTVGISESITGFAVTKSLQDYYGLDDFSQVDKSTTGVKTNIVGITDVFELEHLVAVATLNSSLVGNMVLNG